ncbi:hypothetical protein EW146_g6147 [Bondarzewia mesenterica]|uniref:Golgi apparatus membrane protein tvp38 n=1 Tax=Bondarzewia mesenterica TaxID=1095465 RepID=A0A4S4LPD8_9AGAM|nr:hypothetical protein EW146_g6147 [Bondarzewia mesenterica]
MASAYQAYDGPSSNGYLYPPNGSTYNLNSSSTVNLNVNKSKNEDDARRISRTPSPTPSEAAELARGSLFDWKTITHWRFWIRRKWLWYYVAFTIIGVITILITVYHKQIVHWLTPATNWMHDLPAGWLIPIAVLFVISFPPLFGHEIVAILCGVVWGLWIGFAIVAAGTFVGEVGNFLYACLARVVRDGGFKIALIARLSAIPGHFTTAIFSTCGMGIVTFCLAAFLSLPKQFVTVYLGVLLEGAGTETTQQRIISDVVLAITFLLTIVAMWFIYSRMAKVRHVVIHDRRKARQNKLDLYRNTSAMSSDSNFNPQSSSTDIPLHSHSSDPEAQFGHQQWDPSGRAVGYSGDPRLHAPQARGPDRIPTFRTEGGGGYSADGRRHERPEQETDGVGVTYPISPRSDGRIPVRQASNDSVSFGRRMDTAAPLSPSPPGLPLAQTQVQVAPATLQNTTAYTPTAMRGQASSSNPYVPYVPEQTSTFPTPAFVAAVPISPQTSGAAVTAPYYQPPSSAAAQYPSAVAAPYVSSSSPVAQYAPPLTQYTPITTQQPSAQYAAYQPEPQVTLPTPPFQQQTYSAPGAGAYYANPTSSRPTSPPPPSYTTMAR